VQEVSGCSPGIIATHSSVLQPVIGIVTTIGSDHYKTYRSLEATAREKGKLVEFPPRRGIAILNADDPNVLGFASRTSARVITFGKSSNADVRAAAVSSTSLAAIHASLDVGGTSPLAHTTIKLFASVKQAKQCGLRDCAARSQYATPQPRPQSSAWVTERPLLD
jgi:UDP-N-acetylmuramoyl-tripeptide--D-alanyl-D-alanine ligase